LQFNQRNTVDSSSFHGGDYEECRLLGYKNQIKFEVFTAVTMKNGVFFIRVTKISELGTTQAATSNRRTHFFAAYVGC
jgi:hypothetical protein